MTSVESTGYRPVRVPITYSVVICAYTMKRWPSLCRAVESIRHQDAPVHEILVVIDHCEELERTAARHFESDPRVRVLTNRYERGLSGARNTGIEAAGGSVVAFLDDDACADPSWYRVSAAHFADPNVLGVGGHARPSWPHTRPSWFPAEFDWVVGCSYVGQPDTVAPVRNFLGCSMAFRREALEASDGFALGIGRVGTLPTGCEETELCIRIAQHRSDAVLLLDPGMRVTHAVSPERTTFRYFLSRCYHEGTSKAVISGTVGPRDALSSERSYTLHTLPRAVLRGLLSPRDGGVTRAAAVCAGLAVTAVGYVRGCLTLAKVTK
ncbi:glycosyltransferase family 2 protein [Rhodococcus sp. O3]|uniref:glycosyltransferase family 2 protein n=1 Tax=Rhodococcus sp. O3 TaxID=3404919 RepID=UPI003B677100